MEVSGHKSWCKESEEYVGNVCKPCDDDDKSTTADGWCRECDEYMCSTCFRHHRKGKFCKDHTFLDQRSKGSVEKKGNAESDKGLEKCQKHSKELMKFYCPTHEEVGCGDCMVFEHKACDVEYIAKTAIDFKDSKEFEKVVGEIESCSNQIEECLSSIRSKRKVTENAHEQFIDDAEAFRDEIVNHVNKLTTDICSKVTDMKTNDDDSLNMLEKEAHALRNEISSTKETLKSRLNEPNKLFVASIQLQKKFRSIQQKLEVTEDKNKTNIYSFERDKEIESAVLRCNRIGLIQHCDAENAERYEDSSIIPEKATKQGAANLPNVQSLLERKLRIDNIHVDGEYLSFTDNKEENGVYIGDIKMANGSYFEVEIITGGGTDSSIGIGLVPDDYPEQYFPGWGKRSAGFHTDDGCVFIENSSEELYGQKCGENDIIGCGMSGKTVIGATVNVFFVINGRKIWEGPLRTRKYLYPAVALDSLGQKVKVTFDALMPSFKKTE